MPSPRSRFPLALESLVIQAALAAGAFAVLAFLAYAEQEIYATLPGKAQVITPPTEIGLEYSAPVTLTFTFARKGSVGTLKLIGDPTHAVQISLPQDWHRTEVFGANLADVKSEDPQFGFIRWTLPAGAGMRLNVPQIPEELTLATPSDAVAAVTFHAVDLLAGTNVSTVRLVQVEATVPLWERDQATDLE